MNFQSHMDYKEQKFKALKLTLSDTMKLSDNMELKSFIGSTKKFISHIISGWFPSKRADLSPDGINKERIIDRRNNIYYEKVVDIRTGRVIRDIKERLTDHKLIAIDVN